ncbi:GPO family capsid scaffolding protein [Spongiibacter taiwanensis]|uniref:GPO family capsid scaffolding protein n=1 Tax=Spongiibacter taiwanensis TaxID=1748242 RepID=UPI002035E158|nr:GPO family capsid scaffolding protein [Spongiibacter taiwanensis]USA43321.1 GPO family capsid scaffolding protein [Spongiibacter taiwanensis]
MKSKFFRVAVEGQTTDGRAITREQIVDMGSTYNTEKYGARIWLEHLRGLFAEGPFPALGDVVEVKAEEIKEGELKGKMALYAAIDPTKELIAINEKRQKIYTSIELDPDFAGSGQAYMYGLGITDSPASLGTEALKFSAEKPAEEKLLASRKARPENLFSAAMEVDIVFETESKPDSKTDESGLFAKIKDMFKKQSRDTREEFSAAIDTQNDAITLVAEEVVKLSSSLADLADSVKAGGDTSGLQTQFSALQEELTTLKTQLGKEHKHSQRPSATGGDGEVLADC